MFEKSKKIFKNIVNKIIEICSKLRLKNIVRNIF